MSMGVLPEYIYVHHMYAWCLRMSQEGIRFPQTEDINGFDLPCGCWGLYLFPL